MKKVYLNTIGESSLSTIVNMVFVVLIIATLVVIVGKNMRRDNGPRHVTNDIELNANNGGIIEDDMTNTNNPEIPKTNISVATIKTSKGDIKVTLFNDMVPTTVSNFVKLAEDSFYDSTKFHRIINGFMVQAGDPLTKDDSKKDMWGSGDPGYKFDDEPFEGEYKRGTLAMANSGPNTNGSQFFIMHADVDLPKAYVIFGEIADDTSFAVLDAIADTPVTASRQGENSVPTEDVVIESVTLVD